MRTNSIEQANLMRSNLNYFLTEAEKVEFATASQLKGFLKKKSPKVFKGWQKRFFAVRCKKGFFISYGK